MNLPLSNKSVLLIGNFLSSKVGTRAVSEELAIHLQERGWTVYTTSSQTERLSRLIDMILTTWKLRKSYLVANVEVYSDLAFVWAEAVTFCLRSLNKHYGLTLHGGKLVAFSQKYPARIQRILNGASFVTTPSLYIQKNFTQFHSDISYLPNALDISAYRFRQRLQPSPCLVWLRAFHQIYNPMLAIEVLHRLVVEFPDTQLTMIGPDKGDGSLLGVRKLIEKYNLTKKVSITGAISKEKVGQYLSQSDVFLNTTNYESFGVSVMEAAACGLCIVTTDAGELPYLWEDGINALLVPRDDPDTMANAVRRILSDPILAEKLSEKARTKAITFDWSKILPQWEQLLESLQ